MPNKDLNSNLSDVTSSIWVFCTPKAFLSEDQNSRILFDSTFSIRRSKRAFSGVLCDFCGVLFFDLKTRCRGVDKLTTNNFLIRTL